MVRSLAWWGQRSRPAPSTCVELAIALRLATHGFRLARRGFLLLGAFAIGGDIFLAKLRQPLLHGLQESLRRRSCLLNDGELGERTFQLLATPDRFCSEDEFIADDTGLLCHKALSSLRALSVSSVGASKTVKFL